LTSRDVTLYHRDIGRNPARRQGRYEEDKMTKAELKRLQVSCSKCGNREKVTAMRSCHQECFSFYCGKCFAHDYTATGVAGVPALDILAVEMR
jgi:hypothetical protein